MANYKTKAQAALEKVNKKYGVTDTAVDKKNTSTQRTGVFDEEYKQRDMRIKELNEQVEKKEKEIYIAQMGKPTDEKTGYARAAYFNPGLAENKTAGASAKPETDTGYLDRINEVVALKRERDDLIKLQKQLEPTIKAFEVASKYGIDDLGVFDMEAFDAWANKNGFRQMWGDNGEKRYEPAVSDDYIGIGNLTLRGRKLTTKEQEKDANILFALASENYYQRQAKEHPVYSSAETVLAAPLRGIQGIISTAEDSQNVAQGKEIDLFSPNKRLARMTDTVRQTVDKEYASKWFGGKEVPIIGNVGSMLYNTGMSVGDNAVNMAVGAVFGNALGLSGVSSAATNKAVSYLTGGLMASDATVMAIISNKERGLSDEAALAQGLASGLIELATEKWSIEKIIAEPKTVLSGIVKSMVTEGSEEMTSEVLNKSIDIIFNKDKSQLNETINAYTENGCGKKEAVIKAWGDMFSDVISSGVSGALSGMAMSGVHQGITYGSRKNSINEINDLITGINRAAEKELIKPLSKRASIDAVYEKQIEVRNRLATGLQSEASSGVIGKNGKKAFEANLREGQNEEAYAKGFRRMYNLGQLNIPIKKADSEIRNNVYIKALSPDQRLAAYYAGQNDAKLQLETEKNAVKYVEYYSDDAGVVQNDAAMKVDAEELQAIDRLARTVGTQVVFEEDIEGLNGFIELGKIHISLNAENKLAVVAAHEVTHRMQQLAPESYQKFRDFVMRTVGVETVESYQRDLNEKDIFLSDSEVMDEIAADFTKKILSDPQSMQKFVDEAMSIAENRNILQRLLDSIKEFIKRVSEKFSGRKAEQDQAARDAYGVDLETIKQAKNLLQKALKDSADTVEQLKETSSVSKADSFIENGATGEMRNSVKGIDGRYKLEYNKGNGSKKSAYDEFKTNAMIWARATDRQPGDLNILNANGKHFALIEATADGFIELKKGNYKEVQAEYERVYSEEDKSFYAYTKEIRSKQDTNMWDMQYVGDRGYASGDGEQIGSKGLQADTTRNNEYLREGNQRESVKNSDRKNAIKMDEDILLQKALKDGADTVADKDANVHLSEKNARYETESKKRYSIKNIPGTDKLYVKADEQVIKSQDPQNWESEIFDYVNKVVRKGRDFIIPMDNEESITITERTAWKLSDKGNFANDYYMVKGNASGAIDEIISVSKYLRSKPPMKTHSDGFARYGFDYRKAYFLDLDGKYYELQLSVGINEEGREAYNIGQIKQVAVPSKRLKDPKGTTTSTDNISQNDNNVNTQYMQKSENNSQGKNSVKTDEEFFSQKALKESADTVERLEKQGQTKIKTETRGNIRYSIKKDNKGNSYWMVDSDTDIFKGITDKKELQKAAFDYILHGEKGEIINEIIEGQPLSFTRISANEYVYGSAGKKLDAEDYKKKLRMAPSITDLIENSSVEYRTPDHKNHKFAKDGFRNYRGRVRLDDVIFAYIVRVGVKDNENMFYDINLEVESILPSTKVRQKYKSDSTSTGNISQNDNNVNTQYMQKSENNSQRKNSVKTGEDITNTKKDKNIPYDYTRSFAKQIEDYKENKFPINDTFLVCATPEILQKIGLNALPITMNQEHVDYILNNTKDADHYLGEDFLKKLSKLLEDPLAVIEDFGHNNRLTVLVQYTHLSNGKQSIVPIEVDGYGRQNDVVIDSNAIVTAFAKDGILDTLGDIVANGGDALYYWNKKEALTLLQMAGRQLPGDLPQDGFINSIRKKDSKVKPKFKNVTETQQFIRFFGDWIKNPKRASKVVNEDGTPKVVYHQTAEEFDVFSTKFEKAGKYDSETPVGHFFKSTPEDIGLEGKRQMAAYLNMRRPLRLYDRVALSNYWSNNIEGYQGYLAELDSLKKEYENKISQAEASEDADYQMLWEKFQMGEITDTEYEKAIEVDTSEALQQEWEKKDNEIRRKMKKAITKFMKESNYDGIIIKEDSGVNGKNIETYIVFEPAQIKSATDNVGTFDKNNPNRRYSIKMDEDILRKHETLKKAYARLLADFNRLKLEKSELREGKIATVAKNLLNEFDFAYDSKLLAEKMSGLSEDTKRMIAGNMDMEAFYGKVNEVAKDIIETGTRSDSLAYTESKAMRDYLRTTKITLSEEARNNLGSEYETIRKSTFGRLRLVKEGGTPIDVVYQELSMLYPEYFSTETETNASAQLRQIQSVLDGLQSLKSDAFGGYTDEAAEWLSNLMIDRIYNDIFVSGEVGKTTVSVDIKAMRAEMADNLQRIMARERKWREREYNKLQDKFEKKTRNYTEARQKAIKVRQIKLHTERLSKALINPSERFAVPEDLKKPVAQFLSCINLENDRLGEKTREKLRDLAKVYKTIAEQEYEMSMVVDPDLYEHLEKINDDIGALDIVNKTLSDLNLDTLEALKRSVMAMEASLRNHNMLFHEGKLKKVKDFAGKIRAELEERQDKEYIIGTQTVRDFFDFSMTNPWDFFHQLGQTFEELYQEGIREGENKLINNLNKSIVNMDEALSKYKIDVKALERRATKTVFALQNGQRIELGKDYVMSLYLLWRQPGARDHIMEGGIKAAKVSKAVCKTTTENGKTILKYKWKEKAYKKSVRPSFDDVANIINSLSENEKKFAESISNFFVNECADWGNEVSLKLYGYKKFNTPNYYPIVADKMSIATVAGESADATIKNKGFTQKRIRGANNSVIIESIFDVYARHTTDMAKYNAFVLPLQDMQRVFNYVQKTNAEFVKDTGSETENGRIQISVSDVKNIQSIGRKSVNDFTAEDFKKTEKFAEKYFNELGEKSPFYRARFGDWRENDKSKSSVVIVETRNKEIPRGTFHNTDTGWNIVVSSVGIGDTVSHSGKERLSTIALNNIDSIIENSVILDSEGSVPSGKKGANTLFMHKLYGICDIGGKKYLSKLTVEELLSGAETNKRFYNLKEIKISSALGGLGDNNTASTMRISDDTITVADLFRIVKENDKSFKPKAYAFSMKELIATKFGEKANDYFTKLMIDINGGIKKEYEHNPMAKITSATKKSAMGNNVRVIIQQPLSYTRAGILVKWRYLAKAGLKADMDIIFKYSPIARWKSWGFFDFDTGKSMKDLIVGKKDIGDYTMWAAAKADEATWKRLWNAVELEIANKHPELQRGSDAFYKACGKMFDMVIDRTQVVDSTLHRSQILRSKNDLVKMSTSYMSEPMKTYNIIRTEALDCISGRTTKKHFGMVVFVLAFGAVTLAAITGAWDNFRSDDEEEKYWETALDNLIGDQIGMIPYIKDFYSILQGYDIERMDMQLIDQLVNAFKLLSKEEYTTGYKINNLCLKVADLFGVGASSFKRTMIDMAAKIVAKSFGSEWIEYKYIEKPVYDVNGRTDIFIDTLFTAYRNGHKQHYNKIFIDMMKEGVDAEKIENGLRSRFEKSGIKETFAVPWTRPYTITTKEEDKFGLKNLSGDQYQIYQSKVTALEEDIIGDLKLMRGDLSYEEYQARLKAAYEYSTETALEEAAREKYESEKPWINKAQTAEEKYGIEPAEFIMFYKYCNELTPPAGQEKFKNGEKKNLIIDYLNGMELSDEEWQYLYYEVGGYKK